MLSWWCVSIVVLGTLVKGRLIIIKIRMNLQVILRSKPGSTYPQTNDVFEVQSKPSDHTLTEGQVLVESLYLSIDAAMRVWITG